MKKKVLLAIFSWPVLLCAILGVVLVSCSALQGPQGDIGDTGATGPQGETGETGPEGETGDIGPVGPQGDTGPIGPAGPAGNDGETPYIGANGNWWIDGTDTGIAATGEDGQSAYELYCDAHPEYMGSEAEWLDDLVNGRLGTKTLCTVTFDSNGGTTVASQQLLQGEKIIKPTSSKIGYVIEGWYYQEEVWSFIGFPVEETMTLVARWTPKQYTVTLQLNGGEMTAPRKTTVTYGEPYSLPVPNEPSGETPFGGWVYNNVVLTGETGLSLLNWNIDGDITLQADYFYGIYNRSDLEDIANHLSYKCRVMQDFDLTSAEWTPIGTLSAPFTGEFYGNNCTISNLNISLPHDNIGLFGYSTGKIVDLKLSLVNIDVTSNDNQTISAGAFVGYSTGYLDNLHALSGTVSVDVHGDCKGNIGGIVGKVYKADATTSNSTNALTIIGDFEKILVGDMNIMYIGGLIGYSQFELTLDEVSNSGDITGSYYVGGLIGSSSNDLIISDSFNSGDINTLVDETIMDGGYGGLFGYAYLPVITDCYNLGNIAGTYSVGGLGGSNSIGEIFTSYNLGNVSGYENVGGITGFSEILEITNSYNMGNVTADNDNAGGLIGQIWGWSIPTTITTSYNCGAVDGNQYVGGLIGKTESFNDLMIYNSINFGTVEDIASTDNVGGIIGGDIPSDLVIDDVYYTVDVLSNGVVVAGVAIGNQIIDLSTLDLTFFVTTLGWDTDIWDFANLNVALGVYPELI